MNNLIIEKENIVEKIKDIDDSTPSLEEQRASLKEKRTQLLTEIALRGGNGQSEDIARLDHEIAATSTEIDDNKDIAANLKLRLCKTEKKIRINETAQGESEYVQSLQQLDTLTKDIEKAFLDVERAVNNLHSLSQEYWDCKNKRRAFLEKFRSFMNTEAVEAISSRISTSSLSEDDDHCKESKHKLSELIREINPLGLCTTLRTISPLLVF